MLCTSASPSLFANWATCLMLSIWLSIASINCHSSVANEAQAQGGIRIATFDIDVTPPIGTVMAYDPVKKHDELGLRGSRNHSYRIRQTDRPLRSGLDRNCQSKPRCISRTNCRSRTNRCISRCRAHLASARRSAIGFRSGIVTATSRRTRSRSP